jgi:hypothetical protein
MPRPPPPPTLVPSDAADTVSGGAGAATKPGGGSSDAAAETTLMTKALASMSCSDVFVTLYSTWAHSPIAAFSLCLLAEAYEIACALVLKL